MQENLRLFFLSVLTCYLPLVESTSVTEEKNLRRINFTE